MNKLIIPIAAVAFILPAVQPTGATADQPIENELHAALNTALDDERLATAFYAAVMEKHGQRRPFSNIINAEKRHQQALIAQYERLGFEVPENRWEHHEFSVPDTFAEVCDASVVAEIKNGNIYDDLLESTDDPQVRRVFENLRRASIERHLPAFQRHSNQWMPADPDSFTPAQGSQRKTAEAAQSALYNTLLTELAEALARGNAASAIDVCSQRAPQIAEAVSDEHNVRIGRTSDKLRNSMNTPPIWAEIALENQPETPQYFADRNGRLGALTPIRLSATCLQCHGSESDIAPATRRAIKNAYPDDSATGYNAGDLRGWFWIEIPQ